MIATISRVTLWTAAAVCILASRSGALVAEAPRKHSLTLDFPFSEDGSGSILAFDLDRDGKPEIVATARGHLAAYEVDGKRIWHAEREIFFSGSHSGSILPGLHAPGVQLGDIDGDGGIELLYLDARNTVHVLDATPGREKWTFTIPKPDDPERWELVVLANLRGEGDRDILLQTTNSEGYRVAHYLFAYRLDGTTARPLWKNEHFGALAHGPVRVADLDGDGRDEICGFTLLKADGTSTDWRYPPISPENAGGASFHIDSVFIADARPDVPGLEVVLLEEGRNYVSLAHRDRGLLFWKTNERQEPQNAAVGEFDLSRPGLEIWCRSRYNTHQKPWVFDSRGEIIADYELDDVAPKGWTTAGVEVITPIHWTGGVTQLAAAKERHTSGDVCLFEPLSGRFVLHLEESADRLYVADVLGDWREEIIVGSGAAIHIYENTARNERPDEPRLWTRQVYRRTKMTWDYYSP